MSFGRKGLEEGSPAVSGLDRLRNGPRATQPLHHDDDIARKREAFLAAERARKAELGGGTVSDLAAQYPGTRSRPERSLMMAYLLWFVLGQISAHRFYLGAFRSAVGQVGLFFLWLALALGTPRESFNSVGPVLAVLVIGWILWVLGDVFFIHKLHRKLCRKPGEAGSAAAVFA